MKTSRDSSAHTLECQANIQQQLVDSANKLISLADIFEELGAAAGPVELLAVQRVAREIQDNVVRALNGVMQAVDAA